METITNHVDQLTLTPARKVAALRATIADVECLRRELQQGATFARYAIGVAQQQRSFFARFSVKYGPKQPLYLVNALSGDSTNPRGPAAALARD